MLAPCTTCRLIRHGRKTGAAEGLAASRDRRRWPISVWGDVGRYLFPRGDKPKVGEILEALLGMFKDQLPAGAVHPWMNMTASVSAAALQEMQKLGKVR